MLVRKVVGASFLVLVAGGIIGCGSKPSPEASSPSGSSAGEADDTVSEDEAAAMASIEEYLADDEGGEASGGEKSEPTGTASPQEGAAARRDQLWALVKEKRPIVLACYKEAKAKNPKIGTKIAVRIVLKPDGTLKSDPEIAADRTDITDPSVVACTLDAVKGVQYPPHPNGMETTFTYPFGF
jgi:hypothetical protein